MRPEAVDVLILFPEGIPHFKEHHGKAPDALSVKAHAGVLPVAEADDFIDILIRQIDSAGIGRMPVDNQNLSVIPVVHHQGEKGNHRIEGHAPDARLLQPFAVAAGKPGDAAHIIVDHPDLNA